MSGLGRNDDEFNKEVKDIVLRKMNNKNDQGLKSFRRVTKAIVRHNLYPQIKNDIIITELKDDRKNGTKER